MGSRVKRNWKVATLDSKNSTMFAEIVVVVTGWIFFPHKNRVIKMKTFESKKL